jgi:hypothetical protein
MSNSLQIAKYRWEFIRRNDEYRKDWSSFFANPDMKVAKSLLKKWGFLNFPQSNNFDKPWDEIKRIKGTIWTRELDGFPFWEELKDFIIQAMFTYAGNKSYVVAIPELLGDIVVQNNIVFSNETSTAEKYYLRSGNQLMNLKATNIPDKITIQIGNFKKYLSGKATEQHAFRDRVIAVVDQQLKLWESASRMLNLSQNRKYRYGFEYYDGHLEVWDLVNKHGMKWRAIARTISPGCKSIESEINRVKASYRQACNLIKNAKNIFIEN